MVPPNPYTPPLANIAPPPSTVFHVRSYPPPVSAQAEVMTTAITNADKKSLVPRVI
jgi:hypothetical protein